MAGPRQHAHASTAPTLMLPLHRPSIARRRCCVHCRRPTSRSSQTRQERQRLGPLHMQAGCGCGLLACTCQLPRLTCIASGAAAALPVASCPCRPCEQSCCASRADIPPAGRAMADCQGLLVCPLAGAELGGARDQLTEGADGRKPAERWSVMPHDRRWRQRRLDAQRSGATSSHACAR